MHFRFESAKFPGAVLAKGAIAAAQMLQCPECIPIAAPEASHPTTPTPLAMGEDPKPAVVHELVANRDPELATAWTKHKAITNYENFHNIGFDIGQRLHHVDRDRGELVAGHRRLGIVRCRPH